LTRRELLWLSAGGAAALALPVVALGAIEPVGSKTIRIQKAGGVLMVSTDAEFESVPVERTFNLVPGFEAVPVAVSMVDGKEIRIRMEG
jgi:hypothetical protein